MSLLQFHRTGDDPTLTSAGRLLVGSGAIDPAEIPGTDRVHVVRNRVAIVMWAYETHRVDS